MLSFLDVDLSPLASTVSDELSSLSRDLLNIADPSAQKPRTVDQINARKRGIEESKKNLYIRRAELADVATASSETQRHVLEAIIRALESVKYGSAARAEHAEAGYYAAVAEGLEEKLK